MPTTITLPDSLADRIGAVASQSHRTPLCIIQLCLAAHLPVLEEAAKHLAVFHPATTTASTITVQAVSPSDIWDAVHAVTKRKKGTFALATDVVRAMHPHVSDRAAMKWLDIPNQNHKRIVEALATKDADRDAEVNAVLSYLRK